MATTKTLSVPVRYTVPDLEEGGRRYAVTPGMVDVRAVEADEAPVVMKLREGLNRNSTREIEYRAFEGSLYSPDKYSSAYSLVDRADIRRNPLAWKDYVSDMPKWAIAYNHPFLDNDRRPNAGGKRLNEVAFEPDAVDNPLYLQYLADAREKAARHIVIDGHAWSSCLGPVLKYSRYFHRLEAQHIAEPMSAFSNGFNDMLFDPFDVEESVHLLARAKGRPVEILGTTPEILSREGYVLDTLPTAVQGAAWGVLWDSRRVPTSQAGPGFIAAVSDLRAAIQASWPGVEISFDVNQYSGCIKPFAGLDIPDPALLLAPLGRAVEAHAAQFTEDRVSSDNWRTTVQRLHARVHPFDRDDEHVLEGMAL